MNIQTKPDDQLVSVVVPCYNAARTVGRAIQSALDQDHEALEIIVVDDGSTDGSQEAIRQFSDSRVIALGSPRNRGVAAARNTGISRATGDFVAFLDADDAWLPGKLSAQLRQMQERPKARIVTCDCLFIDIDGRPKHTFFERRTPVAGENGWQVLLAYNFIATPTVLARTRDVVALGGFSEAMPTAEDQDLWIRLAALGELVVCPEVFVHAYNQPDSLSTRCKEHEATLLLSMVRRRLTEQSHRLAEAQIRSIWGQRLFDIAANLYRNQEYGRSAPLFWQSARCGVRPVKNVTNVLRAAAGAITRQSNLNLRVWREEASNAAIPARRVTMQKA